MDHLKRSIRRYTVGCAGLACLILVVISASRCTSDSITGGENPAPENPVPEDPDPVGTPLGVGSVTLSPDSLTVAVEETAQLSVIVRDTDGVVIPNPQVVFTVSRLKIGTVDRNGLVTGLAGGCGVGTVMAWSGGVHSNAAIITVGSPSAAGCGSLPVPTDSLPSGFSRIAFQLDGDIQLVIFPGGGGLVNLTNHPAEDTWPALSPDRSRIVFSSDRDNPTGDFELYSMNVDGSGLVRLTNSPGWDLVGPQAWSPDGSRIVFTSMRDGPGGEIYIMNADGSRVLRLTDNSHSDGCAAWSPDGSSIAFCSGDILSGIYRMGTTLGSPIVRIASEGFSPDWSPDGSKIAYTTGVCWYTGCDIAVIGVDGTGFVQLHPSGASYNAHSSTWSPDGTWIALTIEGRRNSSEVAIVRFEGNGFGAIVHYADGYAPSWR